MGGLGKGVSFLFVCLMFSEAKRRTGRRRRARGGRGRRLAGSQGADEEAAGRRPAAGRLRGDSKRQLEGAAIRFAIRRRHASATALVPGHFSGAETVPAKHPPRRHAFHAPESRTGVADAPNLATPAPVTCLPCRYRRGRRGRCFAGKVGDNLPKGSHFSGIFRKFPKTLENCLYFSYL